MGRGRGCQDSLSRSPWGAQARAPPPPLHASGRQLSAVRRSGPHSELKRARHLAQGDTSFPGAASRGDCLVRGMKAWPPHPNLGPSCKGIPDPELPWDPLTPGSTASPFMSSLRALYSPPPARSREHFHFLISFLWTNLSDFASLGTRPATVSTESDKSHTEGYWESQGLHAKTLLSAGGRGSCGAVFLGAAGPGEDWALSSDRCHARSGTWRRGTGVCGLTH